MDRKGKRRKNKGEKNSLKDDKQEAAKEHLTRSKKNEVHKEKPSREVSPVIPDTNCKNNLSREDLKQVSTNVQEETPQDNYKKRQIISNWGRYEESHAENEPAETKGADINLLLHSSRGSFFRFRDEQEWEEIHEPKVETSEFLLLNSEDLAKAISCIPLPDRLMIKEEHFPPKMLNKFKKSANENMQRYKNTISSGVGNIDIKDLSSTSDYLESEFSFTNEEGDDDSDKDEIIAENSKNILLDNTGSNQADNLETTSTKLEAESITNDLSSHKTTIAPSRNSVETDYTDYDEENELNYLLSLNVSVKPQVTCLNKNQEEPTSKQNKNIEEKPVSLFPESKPTASLEDWLDEMLDEE